MLKWENTSMALKDEDLFVTPISLSTFYDIGTSRKIVDVYLIYSIILIYTTMSIPHKMLLGLLN